MLKTMTSQPTKLISPPPAKESSRANNETDRLSQARLKDQNRATEPDSPKAVEQAKSHSTLVAKNEDVIKENDTPNF